MFEQVTRLDPADGQATLELVFLNYETGRHARALELFKSIKDSADSDWRGTAQNAFKPHRPGAAGTNRPLVGGGAARSRQLVGAARAGRSL